MTKRGKGGRDQSSRTGTVGESKVGQILTYILTAERGTDPERERRKEGGWDLCSALLKRNIVSIQRWPS